jgi:hypothetical protein
MDDPLVRIATQKPSRKQAGSLFGLSVTRRSEDHELLDLPALNGLEFLGYE